MAGQRVGYIRVSTLDQNTVRQLDEITLDKTFTGRASEKDQNRPELEELISFVRDGDIVLVHSMDRLARNLDDLRYIVRRPTAKKVRVEFVKEQLTFTGDDSADVRPAREHQVRCGPGRPVTPGPGHGKARSVDAQREREPAQ